MSQIATSQPGRLTAEHPVPYASVSLGPGIHLRYYFAKAKGHRWEFVSLSPSGKATHYDLPDLGGFHVIHEDRCGYRLDLLASSIGLELKSVLELVIAVANDPEAFCGVNPVEWRRAAEKGEAGWIQVMENLARLHGRAQGYARLMMTEKDWLAVYRVLSVHAELRRIIVGLASAPVRGASMTMWLPVHLADRLQGEAEQRRVPPDQLLLDLLSNHYSLA